MSTPNDVATAPDTTSAERYFDQHLRPILISVFTPLSASGNEFIQETYESLVAQSYSNWEWVVFPNHGGKLPEHIAKDPRVRVVSDDGKLPPHVGPLKNFVASACKGEWLVELDHDDVLAESALLQVALSAPGADFLYSDFAEFVSGSNSARAYNVTSGWIAYSVPFRGQWLLAMQAPEQPLDWRRVLWAPNHLRAWRRSTYQQLGGHDVTLQYADDIDLILRTYLSGARCVRIPSCLYFYRVHPHQNVSTNNALIVQLCEDVYEKYIYGLSEHIARQRGLSLIDLCGGHDCPQQYTPIDVWFPEGARGIQCDLNGTWDLPTSSVGALRAFDAIEHLRDPIHTMNEAWRVLAPGGVMLIRVPSTEGKGAFCDPTHVSFWNDLSFRYYAEQQYRRYLLPRVKARFQISGLRPIPGHIPYVRCELIALKDGYKSMGGMHC